MQTYQIPIEFVHVERKTIMISFKGMLRRNIKHFLKKPIQEKLRIP